MGTLSRQRVQRGRTGSGTRLTSVFRQSSKEQQTASGCPGKVQDSCRSALVSLYRYFYKQKAPGGYLFHSRGGSFSKKDGLGLGGTSIRERKEGVERWRKDYCWAKAVSMYRNGLGAALSAKKASEVKHHGYAILEGCTTLRRLQGKFLNHPSTRILFWRAPSNIFSGSDILHLRARRRWTIRRAEHYGAPSLLRVVRHSTRESETLAELAAHRRASCS